jgi:AcrR family transcriptional regulator
MATPKAEASRRKILDSALDLFRERGFDAATMRDIAVKAEVATGAAYYYYPSKEALVLDFYRQSCDDMQPLIEEAVNRGKGLEAHLRECIRVKLDYFTPNREVLRALLRNGADPRHPLSPFSPETAAIRAIDVEWFRRILEHSGFTIPRDLAPHLPDVLWLYQMGVIFFWVTDDSKGQDRARRLLERSAKAVAVLVRLSSLPLMRPVRKVALEMIEIVKG